MFRARCLLLVSKLCTHSGRWTRTDRILSEQDREAGQFSPVHFVITIWSAVDGMPVFICDVRKFGDGVEQADQTLIDLLIATQHLGGFTDHGPKLVHGGEFEATLE